MTYWLPEGVVRAALAHTPKFESPPDCTRCGDHGIVEYAEVWDGDPPEKWLTEHPLAVPVRVADGRELFVAGYKSVSFCACKRRADEKARLDAVEDDSSRSMTAKGREQTWATWDVKRTRIIQLSPAPGKGALFQGEVLPSTLINWVPASGDLMLTGPKRVGKTHACNAMAHVLVAKCVAALVANLTDLLARERRRDEPSPLESAIGAPVLLLDDIGTSRLTAWECETIYRLVDRRIEQKRATVWSTNLPPSELLRYFRVQGDAIANENASRIAMRITEAATTVYRFERRVRESS